VYSRGLSGTPSEFLGGRFLTRASQSFMHSLLHMVSTEVNFSNRY
jgi:hypothetical protein